MTNIAQGVWAAALTPLNADLSIDTGAYLTHARRLLSGGCNGLAVLGTTGEANSFTVAERIALIEHIGAASLPPECVLVGVGCCAVPDTVTLTRAALAAGHPNVMMLPPFYYKPSEDGLFRAYAETIEAVADPRLRVIIYDFPQMTGFTISTTLLRRLDGAFKGVVVGVKNSSGDWAAMEATLNEIPGFLAFAGSEQFLLPTLRAGGPGCISATANVTHATLAELLAHWRDADAEPRQDAITRTRLALQKYPTISALKEIMASKTGDAGWRRLRAPLVNLQEADAARLIESARSLNLLN